MRLRAGLAGVAVLMAGMAMAGCAHSQRVYVPNRCIQRVNWSEPCAAISASLIKCNGVILTVSCVSAAKETGGKLERSKFGK